MKSFKQYFFSEMIGTNIRCTNHSALSFGICLNTPIRSSLSVKNLLVSLFGEQNIRLNTFIKEPKNPTVNQFIKNNKNGHFFITTSSHAMALHNGELVDTSKKGKKTRGIILFSVQVINHDQQIKQSFNQYKLKFPENIF